MNAPFIAETPALAAVHALVRAHYAAGRRETAIGSLRIVGSDVVTDRIASFYHPCFCLILEGAKETQLGSRRYRYGAGDVLVASVDLPVTAQIVAAPYLGIAMTLNTDVLADLIIDSGLEDTPPPTGMAVSQADDDIASAVLRMLRLLDRPRDIAALAPLIERELLYLLLNGPHRAMLKQIALPDSRMARIRRAIDWIRGHYQKTLKIETLAALAAMSPSAFHRHFKAVTNMSPLQFQKHMRLQEARRRLLTDGGEVAAIGFAVGYDSPSQFSREYHRLFGAPPGRDAALMRAGGVGATAEAAAAP